MRNFRVGRRVRTGVQEYVVFVIEFVKKLKSLKHPYKV
jgi:hypothetical protein